MTAEQVKSSIAPQYLSKKKQNRAEVPTARAASAAIQKQDKCFEIGPIQDISKRTKKGTLKSKWANF